MASKIKAMYAKCQLNLTPMGLAPGTGPGVNRVCLGFFAAELTEEIIPAAVAIPTAKKNQASGKSMVFLKAFIVFFPSKDQFCRVIGDVYLFE